MQIRGLGYTNRGFGFITFYITAIGMKSKQIKGFQIGDRICVAPPWYTLQ